MSLPKLPQLNFTFKAMKRPLSLPCSIASPLHIMRQIIKSFLMSPWTRFKGHFEERITMKSRDQTHAATSRHKNQPFSNNNITILGYTWRRDSSSTLENKVCVKMLLRQYSVCFFTFMKSSKASYVVGKFRPKVGSAKDTHPPWKSEMDGSPCKYTYHISYMYYLLDW